VRVGVGVDLKNITYKLHDVGRDQRFTISCRGFMKSSNVVVMSNRVVLVMMIACPGEHHDTQLSTADIRVLPHTTHFPFFISESFTSPVQKLSVLPARHPHPPSHTPTNVRAKTSKCPTNQSGIPDHERTARARAAGTSNIAGYACLETNADAAL
jgi:hypothetical protein